MIISTYQYYTVLFIVQYPSATNISHINNRNSVKSGKNPAVYITYGYIPNIPGMYEAT